MLNELSDKQSDLAAYMSTISESAYGAGWMDGLEFVLWKAVIDGPGQYGRTQITERHIERLKLLSQVCEGWIYFDANREETFISLGDWQKKFELEFTE